MALPSEVLTDIRLRLDEAGKSIKSLEGIVADLRTSGIDASAQEEDLKTLKAEYRKLQSFYNLQSKRIE